MAYDSGEVDLHAAIECRIKGQRVKTTVGRVLLSEILPDALDFDVINKVMDKKSLKDLVGHCYRKAGTKATVVLSDRLKDMGYRNSTKSGLSISVNDMVIPSRKEAILDKAMNDVRIIEKQYKEGIITDGEKYNKAVDTWAKATEGRGRAHDGGDQHRDAESARRDRDYHHQLQPHLHDGRLRGQGLQGPDEAAGRHARPHGQALGRDHRDPDHSQLPRRPHRAAVLHLHPRRPKGPGGHGVEDGKLRLPHPPTGGCEPGRHRHRYRLRHHKRHYRRIPARRRRGHPEGGRARVGPYGTARRSGPAHRRGPDSGQRPRSTKRA